MKKVISYIIYSIFILLNLSCQKTTDMADLADSFTLRRNGADLPIYVHGNATDKIFVLCLSGGPGDPALYLRTGGWSDAMEEKYAMVYCEQRGTGMTQGKLDEDNFNFEEMQLDVEAMVVLLKQKYGDDISLFFYGHSWGSMLGSAVLTRGANQNLFKGWISSGSAYDWCRLVADLPATYTRIANKQIDDGEDVDYWKTILELVAATDTTDCADARLNNEAATATDMLQKSGVVNNSSASTNSAGAIIVNNFILSALNKSIANDFLNEQDDYLSINLTDKLPEIKLPTLVMHGKYDMHVAFESGQKYYELLGSDDKTFISFDSSAHSMLKMETDKYGESIIDFIEANR